jgi:hypothetical protein
MAARRPWQTLLVAAAFMTVPCVASAQAADLTGTWQADTPDGPQRIVVRSDSSASFGEEVIRWSVAADTVYLAFGDEWVGYHYVLRGRGLTLSGGDLLDPIQLRRIGPPTPLPEGAVIPAAPRRPASGS